MAGSKLPGYVGKILRVNLSTKKMKEENLDETTLKKWVGGVGLAAKYLYDEVPPGVEWNGSSEPSHMDDRSFSRKRGFGSGDFNVTAKGPMTNLAGCFPGQWLLWGLSEILRL